MQFLFVQVPVCCVQHVHGMDMRLNPPGGLKGLAACMEVLASLDTDLCWEDSWGLQSTCASWHSAWPRLSATPGFMTWPVRCLLQGLMGQARALNTMTGDCSRSFSMQKITRSQASRIHSGCETVTQSASTYICRIADGCLCRSIRRRKRSC